MADSWFEDAKAQSANTRKKLLLEAYKAIERPAMLIPSLGGGETWARYNILYRKIQQEMLDLGMDQMRGKEVADLERKSLSREEREKAAAALKEAEEAASGDSENDLAVATRTKTKSKKAKKAASTKAKEKPASSTGLIAGAVVAVLLVGGGGYFFLAGGKKKKRRPTVSIPEPELNFGAPQAPAPPSRTKTRAGE